MPPASTRSGGANAMADASDGAAVASTSHSSSASSPNDHQASPPPPTTPGAASGGSAAGEGAAISVAGSSRKRPATNATAAGAAAAAAPHPALEAAGFSSVAVTGSLRRARPAFNAQGDLVACASGSAVLLLAAGTGEVVTRLQGGHSRPVTALAFGGASGRHLFTAGLDGVLHCWEVQGAKAPRILHTHRFERELLALSPNPADSNVVYLALGQQLAPAAEAAEGGGGKGGGKGGKYRVVEYALAGGGKRGKVLSFKTPPIFLGATQDGEFVVAACASRLCVWSAKDKELWTCVAFDDKTPREGSLLQAVALNPAKAEVATGDVNGRVYLWPTLFHKLGTGLAQAKAKKLTREVHVKQLAARRLFRAEVRRWHAHGVSALAFSPDGHYLLSGGPEAVLVLCQLARGNQAMTFLPRLGAPVAALALSGDGLRCALATGANTLLLVRPMDLAVAWEHKALAHAPEDGTASTGGEAAPRLWAAPPSAARALGGPPQLMGNCFPGRLQLLDAGSGVVRAEVEAVPRNVVATTAGGGGGGGKGADPTTGVAPPCVTHAAMAGDGRVVATVERRVGEEGLERLSLKFWERDAGAHRRRMAGGGAGAFYGLAAVVDRPHEAQAQGRLLALAYHPTLDLVASSSAGGAFSLWARVGLDDEDEDEDEEPAAGAAGLGPDGAPPRGRGRWVCQATVPFKRGPARCVAFSPDGSLLAVGCGPAIALWDPLAVRLLTVLVDPRGGGASGGDGEVAALHFLPDTPRLVCATRRALTVWDLLTLAPAQRYEAGSGAEGGGGEWAHLAAVGAGAALALAVGEAPVHFAAVLRQKGNGGAKANGAASSQQTVVAFNAGQARPLLTYPLPAAVPPILGLALAEGVAEAEDGPAGAAATAVGVGGLYYMTREGVTLLAPAAVCQRLHRPRRRRLAPAGGAGSGKRGAAAAATAVELKHGGKRARLSGQAAADAALERGAGERGATVAELLGTTTGLLPPPSAVFDAFLAGLLPTRLAPAPAAEPAAQQPGAGAGGSKRQRQQHNQQQQSSEAAATPAAEAARPAASSPFPAPLPTAGVRKDLMRLLVADFASSGSQAARGGGAGEEGEEQEGAMNGGNGPKTPSKAKAARTPRKGSAATPASSAKKQKK